MALEMKDGVYPIPRLGMYWDLYKVPEAGVWKQEYCCHLQWGNQIGMADVDRFIQDRITAVVDLDLTEDEPVCHLADVHEADIQEDINEDYNPLDQ